SRGRYGGASPHPLPPGGGEKTTPRDGGGTPPSLPFFRVGQGGGGDNHIAGDLRKQRRFHPPLRGGGRREGEAHSNRNPSWLKYFNEARNTFEQSPKNCRKMRLIINPVRHLSHQFRIPCMKVKPAHLTFMKQNVVSLKIYANSSWRRSSGTRL